MFADTKRYYRVLKEYYLDAPQDTLITGFATEKRYFWDSYKVFQDGCSRTCYIQFDEIGSRFELLSESERDEFLKQNSSLK